MVDSVKAIGLLESSQERIDTEWETFDEPLTTALVDTSTRATADPKRRDPRSPKTDVVRRTRAFGQRVAVELTLGIKCGSRDYVAVVVELSATGMLVTHLPDPLRSIAQSLRFTIHLDDGQPPISATARAVRKLDDAVAFSFEEISDIARLRIAEYTDAKGRNSAAP